MFLLMILLIVGNVAFMVLDIVYACWLLWLWLHENKKEDRLKRLATSPTERIVTPSINVLERS